MAARRSRTRKANKSEAAVFKAKADEFYQSMIVAAAQEKWISVGLLAVHCCISINDAICCVAFGEVSSGSHSNAARVLAVNYSSSDAKSKVHQFERVINKKNAIEYEGRVFKKKDAEDIFKHTERFYRWVCDELNSIGEES